MEEFYRKKGGEGEGVRELLVREEKKGDSFGARTPFLWEKGRGRVFTI